MLKTIRQNLNKNSVVIDLENLVSEIKTNTDKNRYGDLFIQLFHFLKPDKESSPNHKLLLILQRMDQDAAFKSGVQMMMYHLLESRNIESLFTRIGILNRGTFGEEILQQVKYRFLPPIPDKRSFVYLFQKAFPKNNDYIWVNQISNDDWESFFKRVVSTKNKLGNSFIQQMDRSLVSLSVKVSYLGLEPEFQQSLIVLKSGENIQPFLDQNRDVQNFLELLSDKDPDIEILEATTQKLLSGFDSCSQIIEKIRIETIKNGTSLKQSYILLRTEQLLLRMRQIVLLLARELADNNKWTLLANMFKQMVQQINTRTKISILFRKNTQMLAYQIAEHKSTSGEKYITTTRGEYSKFFMSAAAGGIIIAFAAVIKALLHMLNMPLFWQYFMYGLNYALAFVLLYITGASLATKQPTMTAAALASGLDSKKSKNEVSFKGLALTFGKVWRSQFASFAGNLIVVFPLSWALATLFFYITGHHLLHTPKEALQALHDQNPLHSLAWYYACITGFALFLSGTITGYINNKTAYSEFSKRIIEHPSLKTFVPPNKQKKVGDYIQKNLGGIVGNICLGFMLGFASLIGQFFGIPFDIRHITISTAYFGFGLEGLHNQIPMYEWIGTAIGVLGIGFLNFAVSFTLAFVVAMRSRNVSIAKVPKVTQYIFKYFRRHPFDFVYPPKKERTEADVFDKKSKSE